MPGQQLIAPHLTSEAVAAQTSPQARRRRSTRLLKTGSFCSISSEGDGDIFGDDEDIADVEAVSPGGGCGPFRSRDLLREPRGSTSTGSSGKFDPLSDYSEFHNDDACSDISDLFMRPVTTSPPEEVELHQHGGSDHLHHGLLQGEVQGGPGILLSGDSNAQISHGQVAVPAGTQSETGSIDDITYEVPTSVEAVEAAKDQQVKNNTDKDQDVSSCSLSIGSEDNNHPQNQLITVPVTIEHPPPEMRGIPSQPLKAEAACQQATPASIAHHSQRPSETMVQASQSSADCDLEKQPQNLLPSTTQEMEAAAEAAGMMVEPGMRMVLVRDIGIQVSGDSPNLNLARKFKPPSSASASSSQGATGTGNGGTGSSGGTGSGGTGSSSHHHHHHHHRHKPTNSNKQDSLAEKFPAEILF